MTNNNQVIPWGLLLSAWLLALVSSLSAIYIGEVLGQAPCVLCWFQRAFMFPLAVILAVACYYSDFNVWRYAMPLAVIGSLFALAHSLLYVGIIPQPIQPCTATGPSCLFKPQPQQPQKTATTGEKSVVASEPIANQQALVRFHSPTFGPADAPETIVEFFDPSCEA